jgi:hypothetical protein
VLLAFRLQHQPLVLPFASNNPLVLTFASNKPTAPSPCSQSCTTRSRGRITSFIASSAATVRLKLQGDVLVCLRCSLALLFSRAAVMNRCVAVLCSVVLLECGDVLRCAPGLRRRVALQVLRALRCTLRCRTTRHLHRVALSGFVWYSRISPCINCAPAHPPDCAQMYAVKQEDFSDIKAADRAEPTHPAPRT